LALAKHLDGSLKKFENKNWAKAHNRIALSDVLQLKQEAIQEAIQGGNSGGNYPNPLKGWQGR
jgi:hypothetical protein